MGRKINVFNELVEKDEYSKKKKEPVASGVSQASKRKKDFRYYHKSFFKQKRHCLLNV